MKILICDDNPSQCERTKRAIESRGEVDGLAGPKLKDALTTLFQGISRVLDGTSVPDEWEDANAFNGYDLVIVDNNLTGLELEGARLTAETIVGYVRAFTNIPYIVSLNKNLHVDFDLRYLFGDYQSLADVALNSEHLANSWLWKSERLSRFAPWYWPRLSAAADRRKKQVQFLEENFDRSVWEALGFPSEADEYLSLRAKAALTYRSKSIQEVTFQTFFDASRTLPPAEKDTLVAGKNGDLARRAIHQITAYEVDRWLRRDVLGTQDVLIDLPHLLVQMPFLGDLANDLDCWNRSVTSEQPPFGLNADLFDTHVEETRFVESIWAPAPCFWWPSLKSNDKLMDFFFEAEGDWPDAVFCEDVSRFVPVSGEGQRESPQEFEAELAGSWVRRYVVCVDDYLYSPRNRIVGRAS